MKSIELFIQVNIQRVEKVKTPRIPRKKEKKEKVCLKSAKKRKAEDSEKVNSTKKRKTVPTIKKKPIVPEKTKPSYAELMDQLNAENSYTVVQTDMIFWGSDSELQKLTLFCVSYIFHSAL